MMKEYRLPSNKIVAKTSRSRFHDKGTITVTFNTVNTETIPSEEMQGTFGLTDSVGNLGTDFPVIQQHMVKTE